MMTVVFKISLFQQRGVFVLHRDEMLDQHLLTTISANQCLAKQSAGLSKFGRNDGQTYQEFWPQSLCQASILSSSLTLVLSVLHVQ